MIGFNMLNISICKKKSEIFVHKVNLIFNHIPFSIFHRDLIMLTSLKRLEETLVAICSLSKQVTLNIQSCQKCHIRTFRQTTIFISFSVDEWIIIWSPFGRQINSHWSIIFLKKMYKFNERKKRLEHFHFWESYL